MMLLETLTPTELEVYNSIINGNSYKEISEILHIQMVTVKTHMNSILKNLKFKNRYQILAEVIKELKNEIEDLESKLAEVQ